MRAVIQRVKKGSVTVEGEIVGEISRGYVVLLGVEEGDNETDVTYLADKIVSLRIFPDQEDKLNLSILDVQGELLIVSQFTLLGDCRRGRRPSFTHAAGPEIADELYISLVDKIKATGLKTETGRFRTDMSVEIINDGPVTILLDSKKTF